MSNSLPLRSFFAEAAIRGRPADGFDAEGVTLIARALSTKARRLKLAGLPFCLAQHDASTAAVREGLCRGVVLAGQAVIDLGVVEPAVLHELAGDTARAYVRPQDDGTVCVDVWFGKAEMSEDDTSDVLRLCEARRFSAGAGELLVCGPDEARARLEAARAADGFEAKEKTDPAAKSGADTTLVDAA